MIADLNKRVVALPGDSFCISDDRAVGWDGQLPLLPFLSVFLLFPSGLSFSFLSRAASPFSARHLSFGQALSSCYFPFPLIPPSWLVRLIWGPEPQVVQSRRTPVGSHWSGCGLSGSFDVLRPLRRFLLPACSMACSPVSFRRRLALCFSLSCFLSSCFGFSSPGIRPLGRECTIRDGCCFLLVLGFAFSSLFCFFL